MRLHRTAVVSVATVAALLVGACASTTSRPDDGGTSAGRATAHAMGTTTVPADPQRVVVLDTQELDAALSLGLVPVGATRTTVAEALPSFLAGKAPAAEIATVGTIADPNLEAIAALQPDLILSSKLRHEDIYQQLSAIAPTVLAERTGDAWKGNFLLYADALGRKPAAEQQLADYEARAAALGTRVGAADTSVSVVRFTAEEIRLYSPKSFIGTVLADVGFVRPEVVARSTETFVKISPEQLGMAAGDVIFTTVFGSADTTAKVTSQQVWSTLPAVQAGKVYDVSDDVWMLAIGSTGANLVLDDIERLLAG
ncbi:MAG: ABC transporter substrate-binding protein [Pseudonocardia sp.]